MENCSVTKFKVAVSNPNLPILEIMQQITLDALTRGGNMPVSDAQKTALNHFFYEIGAVSNNTLWGKVRTLLLPIIGNGKDYVNQDYRNDGASFTTTYIQNSVGYLALTAGNGTKNISFNSSKPLNTLSLKNFASIVSVVGNTGIVTSRAIGFKSSGASSAFIQRAFNNPSGSIIGFTDSYYDGSSATDASERFGSNVVPVIGLVNVTSSGITLKGVDANGDEYSGIGFPAPNFNNLPTSFTETDYQLRIGEGVDYGIIIDFSEALTDAEAAKVLTAVKDLRSAFLPSE